VDVRTDVRMDGQTFLPGLLGHLGGDDPNIWNSLPNEVVEVDTSNILKNRVDKYCTNQEVFYDFNADLTRFQLVYWN